MKDKEAIATKEEKNENVVEEKIQNEEIQSNTTILENENTEKETKKIDALNRYTKVITIVSIILIIAVMVFSVIFALLNKGSNAIVNGISIKGINVGGLTIEEATNKVNEVFNEQLHKDVTLVYSDYETSILPEQIELKYKITEAINLAYSIGRTGSILKDNYDILNASLTQLDISPAYSYDDELLTNFIESTER